MISDLVTLLFRWRIIKARMCRLLFAFVVHKQKSQGFLRQGPYDVEAQGSWHPPDQCA